MDKTRIFSTLAAVSVLALAGAPAHAQTFTELMEDIGIQKRKQEKMDFSERAPLVLPPSTEALPPPEQAGSFAAANPNWPTDPEVLKEQEEAEKEKLPQYMRRKDREDAGRDIYEIQRAEKQRQGEVAAAPKNYDTTFDRNTVLTPEQLKEVQEKRAAAPEVNVYVEPERRRLTDPPPGYRAPSPAQPYGPPGEDKKKKTSIFSKLNPFN